VEVDVVVRNKNGPVTGLTKDDFTIFDCRNSDRDSRDPLGVNSKCKGKRQPIQVFRAGAETHAPPPATVTATALPPGAVSNRVNSRGGTVTDATVLLFDQINTFFDNKEYQRLNLLKFLQSVHESDRVAVYWLGADLHLLRDSTNDPEKLVHDLTNLDPGLDFATADMRDEITLDAVQKIIRHMSGVPGRKNLVWVKDAPSVAMRFENRRKILTLLREANIAVYPVIVRSLKESGVLNMRGVGRPRPLPMPDLSIQKAARDLGASLGGSGFGDAADIDVAVRTAEADSASAYTLGFYPAESDLDGTLHQLTLALSRTAAVKGGLELHYRTEYLATPQATRQAPPSQISLSDIFESPLNATNIGLTAIATPDPAQRGDYVVDVTVNGADVQLKKQDDRWVGAFRVAIRPELSNGGAINANAPMVKTVSLSLTDEQFQALRAAGLKLRLPMRFGDRTGTLRIVIQDTANGAAGSLRLPLGAK
jgi:VWFA-related protein